MVINWTGLGAARQHETYFLTALAHCEHISGTFLVACLRASASSSARTYLRIGTFTLIAMREQKSSIQHPSRHIICTIAVVQGRRRSTHETSNNLSRKARHQTTNSRIQLSHLATSFVRGTKQGKGRQITMKSTHRYPACMRSKTKYTLGYFTRDSKEKVDRGCGGGRGATAK